MRSRPCDELSAMTTKRISAGSSDGSRGISADESEVRSRRSEVTDDVFSTKVVIL